MKRVVVISDIHGNLAALEAIVAKLAALKPDQVAILGDHALFGPKPTETIDLIRKLQSNGALVTAGTGDIAVADLDYAASFPSLAGGLPPGLKRRWSGHPTNSTTIGSSGCGRSQRSVASATARSASPSVTLRRARAPSR